MRVLITDASHRNALAAVRALGKNDIYLVVGGTNKLGPAFFSTYCKKRYLYSNPDEEGKFVKDLITIIKKEKIDVLLPIGIEACVIISKNKQKFTKLTNLALSDYNTFLKAHDKSKTMKIANKIGVPCPKTFYPRSFEDAKQKAEKTGYPLILKSRKGSAYSGVKIVNNIAELRQKYYELVKNDIKNDDIYDNRHPMVQEYIPGDIYDVCIFADHGRIIKAVTQKRLKTLPVTGGAGIWNITTDNLGLMEYNKKLIKTMKYHGPAQIEFKLDKKGKPRLMEINPKFWGTLDLSIQAGVNFPLIATKVAMGHKVTPNFSSKKGIEYIWLFPYQVIYFLKTKKKLKFIIDLVKLFRKNTKNEISLKDLKPNIITIYSSFLGLFKKENIKKALR